MNFENLKKLDINQLRELAIKQGLTPHHRSKPDTLIKAIIEHATTPAKQPQMQHPAEKKQEAPKLNTEEEVRTACAVFFQKPGFEANFTEETWHFKCKGSEDSGHLSVPMRVIKMKAESVSRGARRPRGMEGYDSLPGSNPTNAYTNTVLTV